MTFLKDLFLQLDATLERRPVLEMRMDGAFFREDVIDVLQAEGVEYYLFDPNDGYFQYSAIVTNNKVSVVAAPRSARPAVGRQGHFPWSPN